MTGEENGLNQVTYWSCRKHGFEVRTGGICPDHPRAATAPGVASPVRGPRAVAHQVEQSPEWGDDDQVEQAQAGDVWSGRGNDAEGMRKRGGLTVAEHSRRMVLQMIASEEASGDPQLLRAAAFRRRSLGMEPRA